MALPTGPTISLLGVLKGLDNEKYAMTSYCLDRKEVGCTVGPTSRLFLSFGGPVCADQISNCPLDRVLTDKNLIYLLNLQVCKNASNIAVKSFKSLGFYGICASQQTLI